MAELIGHKRSHHTKREYRKDIDKFFVFLFGQPSSPEAVNAFLDAGKMDAIAACLRYKRQMTEQGLAPATINRRLAAIRSLAALAETVGRITWNLSAVKGEKVQVYRDTSGVDKKEYKKVLQECDRHTLKGKRDYALLRLLWDNALRRGEIVSADIRDFESERQCLWIKGKGRAQKEKIDLSRAVTDALLAWLRARGCLDAAKPLFCALDRGNYGKRLTDESIRQIVCKYCSEAGIEKQMSPHRVRHSSITAALDATDGNVRKVQKLSRHRQLDTLLIYDDNRQRVQLEISELLSDLMDD